MTTCENNPDLCFSEVPAEIEAAKEGCQGCPLKRFNACRAEGWNHEFGVFGGMSAEDRKAADSKRYADLMAANQEAAEAHDIRLTASTVLESMAAELTPEQVDSALPIIRTASSRKAAGLALIRTDMTARQVGALLGVQKGTVHKWVVRANLAERAGL